jgi:hypothetical protein
VELLELDVFGGENLEWSCFFNLELRGALPNTPMIFLESLLAPCDPNFLYYIIIIMPNRNLFYHI